MLDNGLRPKSYHIPKNLEIYDCYVVPLITVLNFYIQNRYDYHAGVLHCDLSPYNKFFLNSLKFTLLPLGPFTYYITQFFENQAVVFNKVPKIIF